jgi:hypothetical protein
MKEGTVASWHIVHLMRAQPDSTTAEISLQQVKAGVGYPIIIWELHC